MEHREKELSEMNLGVVILCLLLVGCAVLVIVEAGGAQARSMPFVDTYGNTTDEHANQTAESIAVAAPSLVGFGSGLIFVFAAMGLLLAAILVYSIMPKGGSRYSGRHG